MTVGKITRIRAILGKIDAPLPFETAVKIAQFLRRTNEIADGFEAAGQAIFEKMSAEGTDEAYEKAHQEILALSEEEKPEIGIKFSREELTEVYMTLEDVYDFLEAGVLEDEE